MFQFKNSTTNIKHIIKKLEIDNSLLWVLSNKLWSVIKGPISLYFIISYLTPEEQGLWYTFLALGALTVFAEMGFTGLITQFVSHEYAHLKETNGFLKGSNNNRDKLVSLVRYALKFYLIVIPLSIVILFFVGKYFLVDINGKFFLLWMGFSITGGMQLLVSLLQSIVQGFDKIALVQKNIFIGSLALPIVSWTLLYLGFGLSTLIVANIISILLMLSLFYFKTKKIFFQILRHKITAQYGWFNEIIKLQWKYAISWMAGYFIFQFMTPMIYKNEGAIIAGQFGLTLGLVKHMSSISASWIDTKLPKMNIFVAQKNKDSLDKIFKKNSIIGFCIFLMLSILFLFIIWILNKYNFYANRFLALDLAFLIILLEITYVITGFLSRYTRVHKAEPYYLISIIMGVFFFFIISLLNFNYSLNYVLILLNVGSWFIILPLVIFIFKRFNATYYKDFNN